MKKLPKQIKNDKCLICEYSISAMSWSDFNGQVWCPNCGLTYQVLSSKFKEEYLKKIGKTEKDVKMPYCDIEQMIPLAKKYFELTEKSTGQGCFMSTGQDYARDGDRSGNVYPVEARQEFEKWLVKNSEEFKKEIIDAGFIWEEIEKIRDKEK